MKITAIIAAAGNSRRMGKDKLLLKVGADAVIVSAVRPFLEIADVQQIIISIKAKQSDAIRDELSASGIDTTKICFAVGGETRSESVYIAFASVPSDTDLVLVHDGARPYVSASLIRRIIDHAQAVGAAVPVVAPADAILVNESPFNRKYVKLVQTPQAFDYKKLLGAYMLFAGTQKFYTVPDDFTLWCSAYGEFPQALVDGDPANIKITTPSDLPNLYGSGYDVHRFCEGDHIYLGGVRIPFDHGVVAHSDGDVLLHAVMDALLSSAGLPDIGFQFPNTDEAYRGISSTVLLEKTLAMLAEHGVSLRQVTATIIAEAPKIAPLVKTIRDSLATLCGLPPCRVGITATTNEKVGEIGKGEAIAVYASVTVRSI